MQSVLLQPFAWEKEDKNGRMEIKAWCLDEHSEPHVVRINDFPVYCQVELPTCVGGNYFEWTEAKVAEFFDYLCFRLNEKRPTQYSNSIRSSLYYYGWGQGSPYMLLIFKTCDSMNACRDLLSKPINFNTYKNKYGAMQATVCETEICPIRKMLTARNSTYSDWHVFTGYHPLPVKTVKTGQETQEDTDALLDALNEEAFVKDARGNVVLQTGKDVEYQISTFPVEREWIVDWKLLRRATKEESQGKVTHPKILGFDIEVFSSKPNAFPDMWVLEDVAFMTSCVIQRSGDLASRKHYCIVAGNVDDIPSDKLKDSITIITKDEIEMINEFAKLVREYDPDVITGYNILDFDYPYLDARLKNYNLPWPQMGRLLGVPTKMHSFTWESGGFGFNNINDLQIPGRVSIDMYPIIRRNYKLARYNLDSVAEKFLKKKKQDVSYQEMFLTYERSDETVEAYQEALKGCDVSEETAPLFAEHCKSRFSIVNEALEKLVKVMTTPEAYATWKEKHPGAKDNINMPRKGPIYDRFGKLNWCSDELYDIFKDVALQTIEASQLPPVPAEWKAMTPLILANYQVGTFLLTRVMYYCLIDSVLCIDLFDKLTTWVGLIQMSAILGVTVTELFTRGQQISCLSQLYDLAAKEGVILNKRESPNIFFNGGFVFDVIPGVYDGVVVIDFNSLYPSIMMAYNLCYSTLLRPEHFKHVIADDLYNALPEESRKSLLKESDVFTIKVNRPDSKKNNTYDFDQPEDEKGDDVNDDETEDEQHQRVINAVKNSLKDCVSDDDNYYFRWVKPHIRDGLLPRIVKQLVLERKAVRAEQKKFKYGTTEWIVLEKKQLALKCSANSMFGFLGAGKTGKRSLIEGAMCITSIGRQLIAYVNEYVQKTYGAHVVYGDTDSSMFDMHVKDKKDLTKVGKMVAEEITSKLPPPLVLEMEKCMKMLAVARKFYVAYLYEDDGTFKMDPATGRPELLIRGVVLARRDNSKILRDIYRELVHMALDEKDFLEALTFLIGKLEEMIQGKLDYNDLVTIKSVGSHYKNPNYPMKLFADYLARMGKPVKPGERIGYLIVKPKTPEQVQYVGNRMVTPEIYEASQFSDDPLEIDYVYYLEHQFMTSLDMLFNAGFKKQLAKYAQIKYRPNRRCKHTPLNTPVKMICRLIKAGVPLDNIVKSIIAIDNGRPDLAPLTEQWEHLYYEKKPDVAPANPITPLPTPPGTPYMPSIFIDYDDVGISPLTPVSPFIQIEPEEFDLTTLSPVLNLPSTYQNSPCFVTRPPPNTHRRTMSDGMIPTIGRYNAPTPTRIEIETPSNESIVIL